MHRHHYVSLECPEACQAVYRGFSVPANRFGTVYRQTAFRAGKGPKNGKFHSSRKLTSTVALVTTGFPS